MRLDEYDNIVRAQVERENKEDVSMDKFADNVFKRLCKFLKDDGITVWYEVDQLFIEINDMYQWIFDAEGFKFEKIQDKS